MRLQQLGGKEEGSAASSDCKLMLFYTSSCGGHVGHIKASESHSEHETCFFNLQPLSPGLCFNYEQGKIQGGGRRGANISKCLTVVFQVVQDVDRHMCIH